MTDEVEALLERLDDISSRSGHEWNAAKDAAVLIRAQAEEIEGGIRLRDEMYVDARKQAEEIARLHAAAARQEPTIADARKFVGEWLWSSTDRLTAGAPWQDTYMTDAIKMCLEFAKLYAAPVPAGDAVSVPVKPTKEMNLAGEYWLKLRDQSGLNGCEAQHVWRAMLESRPK